MNEKKTPSDIQEEFDRLYLEYRWILFRMVMGRFNDQNIAEDILQEIFYEAWRHREVLVNHPNKLGWLCQTAKYKIAEFMRRLAQCEEYSVDADEIDVAIEEDGYSKAEMKLTIYETLTSDELLRFRRYFLWGESEAEIAKKENVTENNMRVRISRLRKKIEKAIGDK